MSEDSVTSILPTIDGEGEVLKKSDKPYFDPNLIKDGLKDDGEKEGGAFPATSTGDAMSSKQGDPMGFYGKGSGPYEVSGFSVSYGDKEIGVAEVLKYFTTLEETKSVISHNNYKHTTPDGSEIDCRIVRGAPTICVNERERFRYIEGEWIAV